MQPFSITYDMDMLDHTLEYASGLLISVRNFVAQFSNPELGVIELPPLVDSKADAVQLRSVAPLYLASELESAALLPSVEFLAGLYVGGGLSSKLDAAGSLLVEFWKNRRNRFSPQERGALFSRLFGNIFGPSLAEKDAHNEMFETHMIAVAEALSGIDENATFSENISLHAAARTLASNIIPRSGGIVSFAAQEIVESIKQALTILKYTSVQSALGARSVWDAVRRICNIYLNKNIDIQNHVTRGKTGLLILAWLADIYTDQENNNRYIISHDNPVIPAAIAWLQATLSLITNSKAQYRYGN